MCQPILPATARQRRRSLPLLAGKRLKAFENGGIVYDAMLAAVDHAKRWILLETYIFYVDASGRRVEASPPDARLHLGAHGAIADCCGSAQYRQRL
jgi:phosphatidylserine/phosphatidylglycerophosphate/cardiolipin synthase-like enzyme